MLVVAIADVTGQMVTVITDEGIEVMVETESVNLPAPVGEYMMSHLIIRIQRQDKRSSRSCK